MSPGGLSRSASSPARSGAANGSANGSVRPPGPPARSPCRFRDRRAHSQRRRAPGSHLGPPTVSGGSLTGRRTSAERSVEGPTARRPTRACRIGEPGARIRQAGRPASRRRRQNVRGRHARAGAGGGRRGAGNGGRREMPVPTGPEGDGGAARAGGRCRCRPGRSGRWEAGQGSAGPQSRPARTRASSGRSGGSPVSCRSRLIRSMIGGCVDQSDDERSSHFLIGFAK